MTTIHGIDNAASHDLLATVFNSVQYVMLFVEDNCKIVTEERGLQDICIAMQKHDSNIDLIESACSALWSLSMEG